MTPREFAKQIADSIEYRGGYVYPGIRWVAYKGGSPLQPLSWTRMWSKPGPNQIRPGDADHNLRVLLEADLVVSYDRFAGGRDVRSYRRTGDRWDLHRIVAIPDEGDGYVSEAQGDGWVRIDADPEEFWAYPVELWDRA